MPRSSSQPWRHGQWWLPALLLTAVAAPHPPLFAGSPSREAAYEQRLRRAERELADGDYPAAGGTARRILTRERTSDAVRARALTLLGKVLYFNSRVPIRGETDTEDSRLARKEGMELAEGAFRDSIALGGAAANEARVYLADLLQLTSRRDEARAVLDSYFAELGPAPPAKHAEHVRECLEFAGSPQTVSPEPPSSGESLPSAGPAEPLVTAPKKLVYPQPTYTDAARQARVMGTVVVQTIIDKDGEVVCARPLVGLPLGLTEATLEAIHDWRFEPARSAGEPVAVWYNMTTGFSIHTPQ